MHQDPHAESLTAMPDRVDDRRPTGALPGGADLRIGEHLLDQPGRALIADGHLVGLGRVVMTQERTQSMDRHVRKRSEGSRVRLGWEARSSCDSLVYRDTQPHPQL